MPGLSLEQAQLIAVQAMDKVYSSARVGTTTQSLLDRLHREHIEVGHFCDPELSALSVGSPLKNKEGRVLRAVGVSGLTSAEGQSITDALAVALLWWAKS